MGFIQGLSARDGGLYLGNAREGTYISRSLDTLEKGTVWHRLRLESTLPDNARLELFVYCSDEDTVPWAGAGKSWMTGWKRRIERPGKSFSAAMGKKTGTIPWI